MLYGINKIEIFCAHSLFWKKRFSIYAAMIFFHHFETGHVLNIEVDPFSLLSRFSLSNLFIENHI